MTERKVNTELQRLQERVCAALGIPLLDALNDPACYARRVAVWLAWHFDYVPAELRAAYDLPEDILLASVKLGLDAEADADPHIAEQLRALLQAERGGIAA